MQIALADVRAQNSQLLREQSILQHFCERRKNVRLTEIKISHRMAEDYREVLGLREGEKSTREAVHMTG